MPNYAQKYKKIHEMETENRMDREQVGCRTGWTENRMDGEQDGWRTGWMENRMNVEQEGCGPGRMKDRRDVVQGVTVQGLLLSASSICSSLHLIHLFLYIQCCGAGPFLTGSE